MPTVAVLMGSDSDLPTVKEACSILHQLEIEYEARVLSAHRTPDALIQFVRESEERGVKVYIAAAGGAAHLAGVIAAHTVKPVIGIPIQTSSLGGLDSLLATVQMPAGVPVATVAIGSGGAANAALLAAQILSLGDETVAARVAAHREDQKEKVAAKNEKIQKELP